MEPREPTPPTTPSAPSTPPAAAPAAQPAPLATALRLLLPLAMMVSLLLLVGGLLWSGARWLLGTEDGTRRLLGALPGVQVQGLQGALLGPRLQAEALNVQWSGGKAGVRIEGLDMQGIGWRASADAALWLELDIARVVARRVVVDSGPRGPRPLPSPASLAAPLRVHLAAVTVDELRIDELAPLAALSAVELLFDGRKGQAHHIERVSARGWGLALQAGGRIGNQAPLPLQVDASAAPVNYAGEVPPWTAALHAEGPLARLALHAALRGVPRAGEDNAPRAQRAERTERGARTPSSPRSAPAAPQLDATAELRPLEAWPLTRLVAHTEALDLAALVPGAPETRLAGHAEVLAPARGAPVTATARIDNRLPGRWNERRLPLARLELDLRGQAQRPSRVEAPRIAVDLADAHGSRAGHIEAKAVWDAHTLHLDAHLAELTPQRLDGRAAAMTLAGPVALQVAGLPSPDGSGGPAPPWQADARLALEGRVDGAPTAVKIEAEASAARGRLHIARLHASAGAATADLEATLAAAARGGWQLASSGRVANFDPLPWWPGEAGSAWRQGPHRLDADWQLDLHAPAAARSMAPPALLQSLAGNGRVRVHDARLAGVPLAADITLATTPADARAGATAAGTLHAQIDAGGNRLTLDGHADPAGSGATDRWRASLAAGNLAALAPLARLHPALAEWLPRQGSASATVAANGRWPRIASDGQAHVEQLRAGTLAVARGDLHWRLQLGEGGAEDATPLELTANVSGMQLGNQRADQLRASASGTLAAHRIELVGTLPLAPPPAAERLLGMQAQRGTRALLAAQGGWQGESGGGGRWRAHIERLAVGPWDGGAAPDAPLTGALWAETRDLRAELGFGRDGTLETLRAEPGRLQLAAGAIALRWDEVQADWRRERTDFELRADIEPFALAPLLARAQPGMGWEGDLRLAARVSVKAAERFEADMVFERRDGDLHLAGSEGVQLLGLSEFRLSLTAHDGVWDFSPVFVGRSLGEIRGTLRARTAPAARWPRADAPIEGQVQARVADIGIWSAWVPPGWRLGGELRTTAGVGGRFGAPTYTGELSGSGLAVRNLLQGVNVADGQLRVLLAGDHANIERFDFKGGEGRVAITGGATFGATPQARLMIVAEHFRVLGRVDRQVIASGRADLVLGTEASRVDGSFRIDEGLFDFSRADAPSLDDDVTVLDPHAEEAARRGEAAPARARRKFDIAIDVDLGHAVHARGRGVDTGLSGKLRITNPGGRLAVNGTIDTEQGTYAAYGQKLAIEHGQLAFGGPPDNPRLDILAIRPNIDTRVGLLITGNVRAPRVRLYSEPEMGETDKLSWLLLGRAPDGLGRNDTAILQRAAVALLSGEGEAPTDSLLRALGIDEVSLRQSDTDVRETVVSLGKQLSRRWYLGYERGVNATTGTWQLIYRIAQRLTVRAQSGLDSSLDIIWTWRLQEAPAEGGVRKSLPAKPP